MARFVRAGPIARLRLEPVYALGGHGGKYFGSREGYGLIYTSCQESGKSRGLCRRLAAEMGMDEATIRAALNRGELPRGQGPSNGYITWSPAHQTGNVARLPLHGARVSSQPLLMIARHGMCYV